MKVALVHELLTMRGGAERVLKVFAEMFPDAPIYTLLYDEQKLGDWFPASRVRTSTAQKSFVLRPLSSVRFNHHLHLSAFPSAVEAWDFSSFDLVLSSSSAFVHGIITNSAPMHLCYVQSPARYLWDRTHDVLERSSRGMLGPLKRFYLSRLFHRLRIWDSEAADRPDMLIAASQEVQRRIQLYWRRDSDVIYPPIDDFWMTSSTQVQTPRRGVSAPYYLVVSQLAHYKRIDIAIEACNQRKIPLVIAGEGPARRALERIAGPTISFVGYKTDEELRELYGNARALLFPGEEDFGLTPLEALACGTPVIALRTGGATETIIDGVTGEFFDEQTPQSLVAAMEKLEKKTYEKDRLRSRANDFSRSRFEEQIRSAIERLQNMKR